MSKEPLFVLLALLSLACVDCGGSRHSPDEKYYLVATNVKLPYWQQVSAGLAKAADQLKVKSEFVGPDSYNPKAQHDQFMSILNQKPTGILVSASDPSLLKPDIDAAIAQGVPVVTIDADAPDSRRLLFIGTDNRKAGAMGGRVLARQLKFRGAVVVFTMPGQHNLAERLHGYQDVFDNYPQIKITEVIDAKGDPRTVAGKTTELIDKNERVDAFVCLVSFACPEVADVLERKQVAGKAIMAMDMNDKTLDGIQKGVILATIGQKPFTMAYLGLMLLDNLHHYPPRSLVGNWSQNLFSPIPTFIDTGAELIDQDNVDAFIRARNQVIRK